MEPRAGGATDSRGSRGGGKQSSPGAQVAAAAVTEGKGLATRAGLEVPYLHLRRRAAHQTRGALRSLPGGRGPRQPAGPRARQLLARLDARPLAARAAADVVALVRRAGATLRLRPKEAISVVDSAEIEVTDSRLPIATFVEHKAQASSPFYVELVRGSAGFGLTFSGGRGAAGDAPLTVRGLLKDGPAQRCGRLQAGDLVLHINGKSTQGLTHAQVVERIRAGGPRLHLMLSRPLETHPGKPKGVGEPKKRDDRSPDPGGPEVMRSRSASAYPLKHLRSSTTPKIKTRGSPEPHPEGAAEGPAVPSPERRTEGPDNGTLGSPGPWLVPSEERLSRALGVPGTAHLALEMGAGRRRH